MSDKKKERKPGDPVPLEERWAEPDGYAHVTPRKDRSIIVAENGKVRIAKPGDEHYDELVQMLRNSGWKTMPWEEEDPPWIKEYLQKVMERDGHL